MYDVFMFQICYDLVDRLLLQEQSPLFCDITNCVDVFATLHNTAIQVLCFIFFNITTTFMLPNPLRLHPPELAKLIVTSILISGSVFFSFQ